MKTKPNRFLCCFLVVLLTACSIIEKVGNQIQSDSSPNQESEIPGSASNGETPPENAGDLLLGGCPENFGKIVFQYDPLDKGGRFTMESTS